MRFWDSAFVLYLDPTSHSTDKVIPNSQITDHRKKPWKTNEEIGRYLYFHERFECFDADTCLRSVRMDGALLRYTPHMNLYEKPFSLHLPPFSTSFPLWSHKLPKLFLSFSPALATAVAPKGYGSGLSLSTPLDQCSFRICHQGAPVHALPLGTTVGCWLGRPCRAVPRLEHRWDQHRRV